MQRTWQRSLGALVVASALVVGSVGVAAAAEDGGGANGDAPSAQTRAREVRRGAARTAFAAALATIGIEKDALRDAIEAGQTIGQVADANGSSAQEVVDAIVAALGAKVDEAVAAGKIDEARAAKVEERIPAAAERFVSSQLGRHRSGAST